MTLALVLSFVVLAALTTLALLSSNWPAWLKAALVAFVAVFYFWVHDVAHDLSGWPAADPLPERFVLLAAVFDEPSAKSSGALYVWVNAIEDGKPVTQPRAYRLPYSKDLHSVLSEAMKKAREGVSQMGTAKPMRGKRGGLAWLMPGNDEQEIKVRDLPIPRLPEK